MKTVSITDLLTEDQVLEAVELVSAADIGTAVNEIETRMIKPNMPWITAKTGQLNNSRYLAYAVVAALRERVK